MQEYEDLKVLVAEIEADISKAEGGNKAAGTRVRKQMQRIKQAAQIVRNSILEIRSAQQIFTSSCRDQLGLCVARRVSGDALCVVGFCVHTATMLQSVIWAQWVLGELADAATVIV